MTQFDIETLVSPLRTEDLKDSISETSSSELVIIYRGLLRLIDVCLKSSDIPALADILSEISHAYAVEISNRFIFGILGISVLDMPIECIPDFLRDSDGSEGHSNA